MSKLARIFLTLTLVTIVCSSDSSACWLRRNAGRRHHCPQCCPQPACNVPVGYWQPAPGVWSVTPTPQSFPHAAPQAAVPAAAPTGARTFQFKGKTYQAIPTNERGESEEKEIRELPPIEARTRASDGEHFAGVARKAAKTAIAGGPVESFASPGAVLDSILQGADPGNNDQAMRQRLHAGSPRAPEERRNVTVTAFLYATKKETDNDFHLLIGGNPDGGDGRFMTAEVSGLPNPDDAQTPQFRNVRDQYKSFFAATGQELPGDRYVRFSPPIPVTITGSIFFDVDHRIGEVRSGNIVPETVWEIHPVSNIVFGSDGGGQ